MTQVYQMISIIGFIIAGIALVLGLVFWFTFHIWQIKRDLSKRLARKKIAQIRAERGQVDDLSQKSLAARFNQDEEIQKTEVISSDKTVKIASQDAYAIDKTTPIQFEATEAISLENPTEPMKQYATRGTEKLNKGTEKLNSGSERLSDETEVLNSKERYYLAEGFELIQNIVLIHTTEVI